MRSIILALALLPVLLEAQHPFTIGEVRQLRSTALNEERILNIALPHSYSAVDTTRYPLVVLLDGSADEDFIHIAGLFQFASFEWIAWQQPSIVVGIANTDRKRDLTYPTSITADKEKFPTTGGSAAFMRFIADEVLPLVKANYRVTDQRMLIGQSLGGLFATEVMLKRPELFTRYLIVSPSLWWDNGSLLAAPTQPLEGSLSGIASVYIAVGKEGKGMVQPAKQLAARLRKARVPRVQFQQFPDLDHGNILHRATLEGVRWMGE